MRCVDNKKLKAFTLIEVLLYVALISIFTLVLASFWGSVNEINARNKAMSAVNTEAAFILNTISRSIRTASAINTPTAGNSSSTLSLVKSANPTVFSINNGVLFIQEGANPTVQLSSNQVYVNSLSFTNVTNTGTAGAVRIQLELAYVNESGKTVLDYSQTIYDTVSIRK